MLQVKPSPPKQFFLPSFFVRYAKSRADSFAVGDCFRFLPADELCRLPAHSPPEPARTALKLSFSSPSPLLGQASQRLCVWFQLTPHADGYQHTSLLKSLIKQVICVRVWGADGPRPAAASRPSPGPTAACPPTRGRLGFRLPDSGCHHEARALPPCLHRPAPHSGPCFGHARLGQTPITSSAQSRPKNANAVSATSLRMARSGNGPVPD